MTRQHPRESSAWFVPKRDGVGATPVTWQGWALTLGSVALAGRNALLGVAAFRQDDMITLVLIAAFIMISAHKTAGGWHWHWRWRWRWGRRD